MISPETIYYTFSAIAQTLAAAVALLGAFVVLRVRSLNSTNYGFLEGEKSK